MSARLRTLDRAAGVVFGLLFTAFGLLLLVWGSPASVRGHIAWLAWVPPGSPLAGMNSAPTQEWWPYCLLAVAVVCGVGGLCWLVVHLRRRRVSALVLRGDGEHGRSDVAASAVVDAAALDFNTQPGVDSAVGVFRLLDSARHRVARIDAAIDSSADLAELARTADALASRLRTVTGRDDFECLVILRTQHNRRTRVE